MMTFVEHCDQQNSIIMRPNLHPLDRLIRLIIAAVIAVLYFAEVIAGIPAVILGIVAIILSATAIINFCPLYYLLGISTKKQ
jgi:hypothetical protein